MLPLRGAADRSLPGEPAAEGARTALLAGAVRSLLAPATAVLPPSPPPRAPGPPGPRACPRHENPAAPFVPCGAPPEPPPSPSPDPSLGSGTAKNSCGQAITFQAAYQVLSEADGANCTQMVPFYGPAASLFSELEPQGFLCLTGWEVLDPGDTYQVPFATPINPATGKQTALMTRYPACREHDLFGGSPPML
ncbi:hypothetical protein ABPG75_005584 [Micractinium tetrahymenae]